MSALAKAQRAFMREIFAPGSADAGMLVYRASVMANFAAALAATYPVVERLVGEEFFAAAARRFARENASESGDLNDYGRGFPAFLAEHPAAAPLAYLPDVARLEWACHECERAPEAQSFDFAALAAVPAREHAALRFTLHPAVRLVESPHPVAAIHAANQPGRDGTPDRAEGPDFLVVRRVEGRARVRMFGAAEWRMLYELARGEPLAAAAPLAERPALADALARFVAEGIVCGFAVPGSGK